MDAKTRPLAVVTGASSGIGFELAVQCARHGFDLVIAADRPLDDAVGTLRAYRAEVEPVQADLATIEGVERLVAAVGDRAVHALLANAGLGVGQAFLDRPFDDLRRVIDTNVTGTLYLLHTLIPRMRERGGGRVLVTGSIAGYMPGSYHAVYNATKAFLDSFSWALRCELEDSGVTVTCLMPGATDTDFFARAGMLDTRLAQQKKDDPAMVARLGFEAMMAGEGGVVTGLRSKLQVAAARVAPAATLAAIHRTLARPGSARPQGPALDRRRDHSAGTGLTPAAAAAAPSPAALQAGDEVRQDASTAARGDEAGARSSPKPRARRGSRSGGSRRRSGEPGEPGRT